MQLARTIADFQNADVRLAAVRAAKRFARRCPDAAKGFVSVLVPPLMERVKDRSSVAVKLLAERALLHLLRVQRAGDSTLEDYLKTVEATAARNNLSDYAKRILSKLPEDSDDDDDPIKAQPAAGAV